MIAHILYRMLLNSANKGNDINAYILLPFETDLKQKVGNKAFNSKHPALSHFTAGSGLKSKHWQQMRHAARLLCVSMFSRPRHYDYSPFHILTFIN